MRRISLHLLPLTAAVVLCLTAPAAACNVPVFRYALERWPCDAYDIVIFHDGPLTAEQKKMIDNLDATVSGIEAGQENFIITVADVTQEMSERVKAWHEDARPAQYPWLFVQYPHSHKGDPPAHSGPLDIAVMRQLADSPLRRQIARKILEGESVVWLFIESGDKARDDAAYALLIDELAKLQKELKLPELTTDDTQFFDPRIGPKLKLTLSAVRVSRNDAAERMFIALLENWAPGEVNKAEPAAYPFFGRGRTLPGMYGEFLTARNLRDANGYLTGPCGCQVKLDNPGFDVLMTAEWEGLILGHYTLNEALPRLTTPAAAIGRGGDGTGGAEAFGAASVIPVAAQADTKRGEGGAVLRNVAIALGLGVLVVVIGAVWLRAKAAER